jgi:hypothetical protein
MMSDQLREATNMIARLPHAITEGVTATREGLVFRDSIERRYDGYTFWEETTGLLNALQQIGKLQARKNGRNGVVSWPDAAERLRYREGEPWCRPSGNGIYCAPASESTWVHFGTTIKRAKQFHVLHRLAAILCDTAESFRVLHWCVRNLQEAEDE